MTRPLIFDLDGTLVDSCQVCVAILSEMLEERGSGLTIDPVAARSFMSRGGAQMVAALLGSACGDPELELADFRQRYRDRETTAESLFPGVAASVSELYESGAPLAICSNKPQFLCEKVLDDTGLAPFFGVVVGGQPGKRPKPEPDLLDAVLAQLAADPDDCLYIGDSELDHQLALARGIPFLFVTYGYAKEGWLPEDCDRFDCFTVLTRSVIAFRGAPLARVGHA